MYQEWGMEYLFQYIWFSQTDMTVICKGLIEIAPKDLVVKNGTDNELDSYFVIEG